MKKKQAFFPGMKQAHSVMGLLWIYSLICVNGNFISPLCNPVTLS